MFHFFLFIWFTSVSDVCFFVQFHIDVVRQQQPNTIFIHLKIFHLIAWETHKQKIDLWTEFHCVPFYYYDFFSLFSPSSRIHSQLWMWIYCHCLLMEDSVLFFITIIHIFTSGFLYCVWLCIFLTCVCECVFQFFRLPSMSTVRTNQTNTKNLMIIYFMLYRDLNMFGMLKLNIIWFCYPRIFNYWFFNNWNH